MPTCNEDYGCGRETSTLFSVSIKDYTDPDADDEGFVSVKVCRDCVASGSWDD
jgi:hypothetical protein